MDKKDANYDRENGEHTKYLAKRLWQETCKKRNWNYQEAENEEGLKSDLDSDKIKQVLEIVVPY